MTGHGNTNNIPRTRTSTKTAVQGKRNWYTYTHPIHTYKTHTNNLREKNTHIAVRQQELAKGARQQK
jgi:hypothetical protein